MLARALSSTSGRSAGRTRRRPGSARRRRRTASRRRRRRSRRRARSSSCLDLARAAPRLSREEAVVGVPLALDQRVPDEQLAGRLRVDPAVADRSRPTTIGTPVERHPLVAPRRAALRLPVRLAVGALDQVPAELLGPARARSRGDPRPTAARSRPARRPSPSAGGFWPAPSPGQIAKRRAAGAPGSRARSPSSRSPMCDSRPASSARVHPVRRRRRSVGCPRDASRAAWPACRSWRVQVLPLPDPQVVQELAPGTSGGTALPDSSFCCSLQVASTG